MISLSTLFLTFSVSAFSLFVGYAMRRSLHPFNSPPGPKGLPFFGSVLEISASEPWLTFTQWASLYGDLVYCTLFGRHILVVQTTDVAKALFEQRSTVYSDRPPVKVHKDVGTEFNSALLQYGEKWRLHRRLFHQSFRAEAARDYLPIQLRKVRQLLIGVYNSPDSYQRQIELYASAVIMSAVYDYETIPNDDPLVLAAERAIEVFVKVAGPSTAAILEAFPFLLKLPVWFPGATLKRMAIQAKSNLHEMMDVPFRYAYDRVTSCVSAPCMVSESLKRFPESNSEGFELALKSSSATAFIAGVETTASTLIVFVLAMMYYPEVQQRVQKEIDAVVGTHRLPNFEDRSSLPYVNAVLRETLRWHPVFPLGLPHYTTKSDVYKGHYIPEGCVVLANIWAMSRDEVKYPNPTEFIPERFINQDGELNDDSVALAFGFGRRICVGRHFADASVWVAIVHLLAIFKFMKPVDENGIEMEPKPKWSSGLVSHPLELKCRVIPRYPGMDADKLIEMIRSSD
ncbi:cytochrome P450 [Butyriboletus roseoflavus]|nr:cytochrome P450 [Butyriboletus roseoflavus]